MFAFIIHLAINWIKEHLIYGDWVHNSCLGQYSRKGDNFQILTHFKFLWQILICVCSYVCWYILVFLFKYIHLCALLYIFVMQLKTVFSQYCKHFQNSFQIIISQFFLIHVVCDMDFFKNKNTIRNSIHILCMLLILHISSVLNFQNNKNNF